MKKITIGRNNECDIIIPDTTDYISRKQALLTISFWGKMVLYDTSGNGTYVNGHKLEKGKGIKVTRKDKVNFAKTVDLDWNQIKDPYRKNKLWLGACILIILLAIVLLSIILLPKQVESTQVNCSKEDTTITENNEQMPANVRQSTNTVQQKRRHVKKKNDIKIKNDNSDKNDNDRINTNIPIVY